MDNWSIAHQTTRSLVHQLLNNQITGTLITNYTRCESKTKYKL